MNDKKENNDLEELDLTIVELAYQFKADFTTAQSLGKEL